MWDLFTTEEPIAHTFINHPCVVPWKACLCLPADALVSHDWTLTHFSWFVFPLWKENVREKEQIVWEMGIRRVCAHANADSTVRGHAHTSLFLRLCLCNATCDFRPLMAGKVAAPPRWPTCIFRNESVPVVRIRRQPTWLWMGNCWD